MAPHTGLRLGYLFLSPFAYEPVRWLKLAKAPAVKPEFKSCGRDRRSESSLPSCPLSSALHRCVHAFASAPMKRISTCQSAPPPPAEYFFLSGESLFIPRNAAQRSSLPVFSGLPGEQPCLPCSSNRLLSHCTGPSARPTLVSDFCLTCGNHAGYVY